MDRGLAVVSFLGRSRWLLMMVLLGAGHIVCLAQDAPASYPVRGVVLNSLNHEPIARALVEASGTGVLTDGNGHFDLNLPAGSVTSLSARRPGYVAVASANHTVHVVEGLPELSLFLTPQAVIVGHISASSGEDADGTRVIAYRRRTRRSQQWWETQGLATTDSAGHFRFTNLQTPGDYLLMTVPSTDEDGRVHANSSTYGYPAAFYPDGAETSAIGLLSLTPGQQVNIEIGLTRQPFYPVTIQVKNDLGATPLSVQVHDETGLAGDFPTRWNAQKRIAQTDLPNGHYFAELRSYNQPELYGRIEFTVAGGPVAGLSAVVLPLHPVRVEIHKEFVSGNDNDQILLTDGPASRPRSAVVQANPGVNISLMPADGASGQVGSLEPVRGATDPSLFQLNGVNPGRYWVRAAAFEGYVASITSGGVDLSREALTVGPGNTTPPLAVTLRNDGGTIHCTVHDPASASRAAGDTGFALLFAIPTSPTAGQALQGAAGTNGDATLSNASPGTYSVIAVDQFIDIDSLDQAVLNSYLSKGQTVSVEAQGSANVTLDVLHVNETGAAEAVVQ